MRVKTKASRMLKASTLPHSSTAIPAFPTQKRASSLDRHAPKGRNRGVTETRRKAETGQKSPPPAKDKEPPD